MYSNFFSPYPFFTFSFIIINFFVHLPVSFSTDSKFRNCSQPFNCGGIRDVFYPFWGHGRADYCGLPGYQLKCEDDKAEIEIDTHSYHVLDINKSDHSLRLATTEPWSDNCPSEFHNMSLPLDLFPYSRSSNQNITLFYGCPSNVFLSGTKFSCSVNDTDNNYFWADYMGLLPSDLLRCKVNVIIHVLQTLVQSFTSFQTTLENVMRDGFDVGYVMNVSLCNGCEASGGQCGHDANIVSTCFCHDHPYQESYCPTRPPKGSSTAKKALIVASVSGVVIVVMILILICYIRKPANGILHWKKKTDATTNFEAFLKHQGSLALKRYNFKEVKTMTKSFKTKLGQGGFGGVFKGMLNDGQFVAVKVLSESKGTGEEFINEVASISRTSHVNIVRLLGYCFDGSKRALIYEFMPNGSLEKYIYKEKKPSEVNSHLGWGILYQITVGIARGLEYLHRGCNTRILHFDIKPHNILLDQDLCPKISDFGLAKLCPRKESIISMLGARGTAGYIAPEVFSRSFGGVSHKSDVYSYGMMILEMVGGRKNIDVGVDHISEIYFPSWIYKRIELDEDLGLHGVISKVEEEKTRKMILVGLWCIQTNPSDRPSMSRVLEMLESSLEVLSIPPKPYLSSPPRVQGGSSIN